MEVFSVKRQSSTPRQIPKPRRPSLQSPASSLSRVHFSTTTFVAGRRRIRRTPPDPISLAVPSTVVLMSAASSSLSIVRCMALPQPLICCPSSKEKVCMYVSSTEKHDGWILYKCQKHGVTCDFWRRELEYVEYLVDKHYLVDDVVVDVIGAAEDRREELLNARELSIMNASTSRSKQGMMNQTANVMTRQQARALMRLGESW